jgi:hypothetical protein
MKKRYDYKWASEMLICTGLVFWAQVVVAATLLVMGYRNYNYWLLGGAGVAFALASVYSGVLICLNARKG